jgi:RHS repeat-associated protein
LVAVLFAAVSSPARAEPEPLSKPIEPPAWVFSADWHDEISLEYGGSEEPIRPQLSVRHDKSVQDGVLGQGYRLEGVSEIIRTSSTGGVPGFTSEDTFWLGGARLIPAPGGQLNRYVTESDTGARISYRTRTNLWAIEHEGWTQLYGANGPNNAGAVQLVPKLAASKRPARTDGIRPSAVAMLQEPLPGACDSTSLLARRCETALWQLSTVQDPHGNSIQYIYRTPSASAAVNARYGGAHVEAVLETIEWKDANGTLLGSIRLSYETRPDVLISYRHGVQSVNEQRLSRIKIYVRDRLYSDYSFAYQHPDTPDCNGRANPASSAYRSRLQRIVRHSVEDADIQRQLRCVIMNDVDDGGEHWSAPRSTGNDLVLPNTYDTSVVSIIPMVVDGNSRADLAVILKSGQHIVAVGTGSENRPFSTTQSPDAIGAWKTLLQAQLTNDYIEQGYGWALTDFTNDGYPDLLFDDRDGSERRLAVYDPGTTSHNTAAVKLSSCSLRYMLAADIDGDGYTDLIFKPRSRESAENVQGRRRCNERTQAQWMRNLGRAPWFDRDDPEGAVRPLSLPLLSPRSIGGASADELNIGDVAVKAPFSGTLWTSPRQYVADQFVFSDLNGDGITDAALAMHRQWHVARSNGMPCDSSAQPGDDGGACQWRPVRDTQYSQVFWGDGYGGFSPSGLSAGEPSRDATWDLNSPRYFMNFLRAVELDRGGRLALLHGRLAGTAVAAAHYRGALLGYGALATSSNDGGMSLAADQSVPLTGYPHEPVNPCCRTMNIPVFADFTGNGFPDLLQFRFDKNGIDDPECFDLSHCFTIRYARLTTAAGRVIESENSWGGRTKLAWSFTGESTRHEGLLRNIEVLHTTDDAVGLSEYAYAMGRQQDGEFRGFGLASVRNSNGGFEVYAQALSRPLQNRPLYHARYRENGRLDKVVVFASGLLRDGAYAMSTVKPYFNPEIRQCTYEIENNSTQETIPSLIRDCWSWNGRLPPSHRALLTIAGWRVEAGTSVLERAARGELTAQGLVSLSSGPTDPTAEGMWLLPFGGGAPATTFRWPTSTPEPEIPSAEAWQQSIPDTAKGSGYTRYVTDRAFNRRLRKPTRIRHHRDTATAGDDLEERLSWEPIAGDKGLRLTRSKLNAPNGSVLQVTEWSAFSGFSDARVRKVCHSRTNCNSTEYTFDASGKLTVERQVEANRIERRTLDPVCGTASETDAAGQTTRYDYDVLCRKTGEEFNGVKLVVRYDGFHRVVEERREVARGAKPLVTRYYFDDDLKFLEDGRYREPRHGVLRHGVLGLTYRDGFGRTTKTTTCLARAQHGGGDLPYTCDGAIRVTRHVLYGSDGSARAIASPYFEKTETPYFTFYSKRDGLRRITLMHTPAHVPKTSAAAWVEERTYFAPGRRVHVSPADLETVESSTTLSRKTTRGGEIISSRKLDRRGMTQIYEDADAGAYVFEYDARGRLVSASRPTPELSFLPDGQAKPLTWRRSVAYNNRDLPVTITEPDGTVIDFSYDDLDRVVEKTSTLASGESYTDAWIFSYGGDGTRRTEHVNMYGGRTVDISDGLNRLVRVERSDGTTEEYAYDPDARTTVIERRDGALILSRRITHNAFGAVDSVLEPDGTRAEYTYDGSNKTIEMRMPSGGRLQASYAQSTMLLDEHFGGGTDRRWLLSQRHYTPDGLIANLTKYNRVSSFEYDGLRRLASKTQGKGEEAVRSEFRYLRGSNLPISLTLSTKGAANSVYEASYDSWRRNTASRDPESGISKFVHGLSGTTARITDAEGAIFLSQSDFFGRLLSQTNPAGATTLWAYEIGQRYAYKHPGAIGATENVLRTTITDPAGAEIVTWTDPAGRVIALSLPSGALTEFVYDGSRLRNVWRLDASNDHRALARTQYRYNEKARLIAVLGPEDPGLFTPGSTIEAFGGYKLLINYNANGTVSTINAAGERLAYEYDDETGIRVAELYRGLREETVITPSNQNGSRPFVIEGKRIRGTDGSVRSTAYMFDTLGRVTSREVYAGGKRIVSHWSGYNQFGDAAIESRTDFIGASQMAKVETRRKFDRRGSILRREVLFNGHSLGASEWTWYRNGVLRSEQSLTGERLTYEYGRPFDHLTDRILAGGRVYTAVNSRDAVGRVTSVTTEGHRTDVDWTPGGRIAMRRYYDGSGTETHRWRPSYDSEGHVTQEEIVEPTRRYSNSYEYNVRGHLIAETRTTPERTTTTTYRLNPAGYRTATLTDGTVSTILSYDTTQADNRVMAVNGRAITYDPWEGVTRDHRSASYARDAAGLVATIEYSGTTRSLFRDARGMPIIYDDATAGRTIFDWGLDPANLPNALIGPNGNLTYVSAFGMLLGRLSDVDDIVAPAQNAIGTLLDFSSEPPSAFGVGSQASAADPFTFGGLQQVNGIENLFLARLRAYDAEIGQFLSIDPSGLRGGWHRTLYASANPVQLVDPLGLWACARQPGSSTFPDLTAFDPLGDLATRYADSPSITGGSGNITYDQVQREMAGGIDPVSFVLPDTLEIADPIYCNPGHYCGGAGRPPPLVPNAAQDDTVDSSKRSERNKHKDDRQWARAKRKENRQAGRVAKKDKEVLEKLRKQQGNRGLQVSEARWIVEAIVCGGTACSDKERNRVARVLNDWIGDPSATELSPPKGPPGSPYVPELDPANRSGPRHIVISMPTLEAGVNVPSVAKMSEPTDAQQLQPARPPARQSKPPRPNAESWKPSSKWWLPGAVPTSEYSKVGYDWTPNWMYGETHPMRGHEFAPPTLEIIKVGVDVGGGIGPVEYSRFGGWDRNDGFVLQSEETLAPSLGPLAAGTNCEVGGGCNLQVEVTSPAGAVAVKPETNGVEVVLGPHVEVGHTGGHIGVKAEGRYSLERIGNYLEAFLMDLTGTMPEPPETLEEFRARQAREQESD